jgi:hypothetical protein
MVLTENLYSQDDSEGHTFAGLQEIIGHERDSTAVSSSDLSDRKPCFTTKGWKLQVAWKDGTSS